MSLDANTAFRYAKGMGNDDPIDYDGEPFSDFYAGWQAATEAAKATGTAGEQCTCPSGDGSLRWPCPQHPPLPVAITDKTGPNGIKWYVEPNLPDGVNLYIKEQK